METKPQLSATGSALPLPKLGMLGIGKVITKAAIKRGIDVYFSAKATLLRTFRVIDFSVPPNHNLRTTSSHTIRHYYESGITTLLPILTAAQIFGVDLEKDVSILDFACGVGRQLLQLTRLYPNVRTYACDINDDAIRYLQRTYPKVNTYCNNFDPPLAYAEGTFDLLYSVSIFSHLSEEDARLWLAELKRVTKPGGILCLTFNSFTSLAWSHRKGISRQFTAEQLQEQDQLFEAADQKEFARLKAEEAITKFGAWTRGVVRVTGHTYMTQQHARRLFEGAGLEILTMLPGVIDRMQDLAVLRRPA